MVFVKFHKMNRKKKFLMSPSNSNKLKKFHFTTSQNNVTITVQNVQFSFLLFFNLCSDVLSISLKMSVLSFFLSFFLFHMLCSTRFKFLFLFFSFCFLFFSFSPFSLSCSFMFLFWFSFLFSFFFFHNKLLIQCPFFFFQPHIYLSVFTLTR